MKLKRIIVALAILVIAVLSALSTPAPNNVANAQTDQPPMACVEEAVFGGEVATMATSTDGLYLYTLRGLALEVRDANNHSNVVGKVRTGLVNYGHPQLTVMGNYVLALTYGMLTIFDVSDPTSPVEVTDFTHSRWVHVQFGDGYIHQIATIDSAHLLAQAWPVTAVLDMTDPTHPKIVTSMEGKRLQQFVVSDNYAFGFRWNLNGLTHLVALDLKTMTEVGAFELPYPHPTRDTERELVVWGTHVAFATWDWVSNKGTIELFDVSDPAAITHTSSVELSDRVDLFSDHPIVATAQGVFVYSADRNLQHVSWEGTMMEMRQINEVTAFAGTETSVRVANHQGLHSLSFDLATDDLTWLTTAPTSGNFDFANGALFGFTDGEYGFGNQSPDESYLQSATLDGEFLGVVPLEQAWELESLMETYLVARQPSKLVIINVSKPDQMQIIGELPIGAADLLIEEGAEYGYITFFKDGILQLGRVDFSNPTRPQVVDSIQVGFSDRGDIAIDHEFDEILVGIRNEVEHFHWDAIDGRLWEDAGDYPAPYLDDLIGAFDGRVFVNQHWQIGGRGGIVVYDLGRVWERVGYVEDEGGPMHQTTIRGNRMAVTSQVTGVDIYDISPNQPALLAECQSEQYSNPQIGPDDKIYVADDLSLGLTRFTLQPWPTETPTPTATSTSTPTATETPEPSWQTYLPYLRNGCTDRPSDPCGIPGDEPPPPTIPHGPSPTGRTPEPTAKHVASPTP